MTKEDIRALIETHIAGQGNQVDSGSVMGKILNGILDLIP